MSRSDHAAESFAALASDLAALCAQAVDEDRLADIPDDSLGQVFASVVRAYAAKAQNGGGGKPFGRNSSVTATDVAIGCTAMLDSVAMSTFELGAWQSLGGVGRHK